MEKKKLLNENNCKALLIVFLLVCIVQLLCWGDNTNKAQAEDIVYTWEVIETWGNIEDNIHNCVHWNWDIYRGIHWLCNSSWQAQDIPDLQSSSREERMRELLREYWKEYLYETFFYGWKMFGIYPELAICIAKADTSLWRQTKSKNNLWNVWNNDRGNTVEFDDEYKAVRAIYQTLNNQYLWGYQYIWELSRKYNKEWKVYATSEENWHNNVVNCMWVIRGETVNEHFAFRF